MAWARSSPAWVLSTNPRTPARTASVTSRSCSSAVSITTWMPGRASTIWRAASIPFSNGIMMSSTATSGSCCRASSTAALPSDASATTSTPCRSSRARTPGQQDLFAQGREVGERARGHVPGGELIDLPFYQYDNKVTATREALRRGRPAIYEAWFLADDTYVGVDILERTSRGYTVIEVKASNSRKPEHLPDAAVQVHVLRGAGLQVERAEVMHLNPECRFPDLSNLFVREDVTALVEAALIGVPDELAAQQRMLEGPLPDVPIGEHCTRPYDCPFLERCWPKLPDHHVSKLYRIERKRALELEADGYATIYDLPSDLELSVIHARQVKAVQTGRMVVEPTLAKALPQFASPLAFLDFETVSLAIPRWPGCRPWQQVPVQFSAHREERGRGGSLVHHEWIAEGPADPRPALAEALVEACAESRKVVAYHASFERECLKQLREAVPRFAKELERIEKRLVDLLPVSRRQWYHPES